MRFELTRKGEGNLYLPYEVERGPANPEFPSGIVERTIFLLPGIELYLNRNLYLNFEIGKKYIKNYGNIPDSNKKENLFNLWFWFLF